MTALLVDPGRLHAALGLLPDPGGAAHALSAAVLGEVGPEELIDPSGVIRAIFPGLPRDQQDKIVKAIGASAAAALFPTWVNIGPAVAPDAYPGKVKVVIPWWVWMALLWMLRNRL